MNNLSLFECGEQCLLQKEGGTSGINARRAAHAVDVHANVLDGVGVQNPVYLGLRVEG